MHIFFIILYALLPELLSPEGLYYLLSLHFAICIILHVKREKKAIITPIFIFYLSTILVNYANVSLIHDYEAHNLRANNYLLPQYILEAAQIWCISCTLIVMGYNYNKYSLPAISLEITNKKHFKVLFWVLLIVNLQSILLLTTGIGININPIRKYFELVNIFSILFFAKLWTRENNKTYGIYALTLYVIITYIALVSAFLRTSLILPTVSLFMGYFIGKANIKSLFTYRIIPFLGILAIYANSFKELQSNRSNFYSVIFESKKAGSSAEEIVASENVTGLVERSSNLQQMTSLIGLVHKKGFYEGRASEPLLTALIPRVLWPNKPIIALGSWFALEIGAAVRNDIGYVNNSINMTIPGQFYLDFGWFGVVIGSFLMGMFYCLMWRTTKFYSSEYNLTGIIFGGYLFLMLMGNLGGDLQIVITLLSVYFSFFLFTKIMKAK